eukprot:792168-Lingulodinium_polyedra.AAC.1
MYGYPSDIWAIGCVCLEMSEFKLAFVASSEIGMLFNIFRAFGSPGVTDWPKLSTLPLYREGKFPNFRGGMDSKWGERVSPQYALFIR